MSSKSRSRRPRPKSQYDWSEVKSWLDNQLDNMMVPRRLDVVNYARKINGASRPTTITWLEKEYPSYRDRSTRPVFKTPRKVYRSYFNAWYTTVAADLCFFGPSGNLLREINVRKIETEPVLIAITIATRKMFAIPLRGGKTAKSLVRALSIFFDQFYDTFNETPKRILFDQEKAMASMAVTAFLVSNNCKVHFYKFSKNKSVFAENAIRLLRTKMAVLRDYHGVEPDESIPTNLKWYNLLEKAVESYNNSPIVMYRVPMSKTPNEINHKNFAAFRLEVERKFGQYSILSLGIDPKLFKFKIPIGARVKIKRRAIQAPGIGRKWKLSEQPLTNTVWKVNRHAVYLTRQWMVLLMYHLSQVNDPSIKAQFEEAALKQISA